MNYSKVAAISAAGMTAQELRLQAAAMNIANINTSAAPGARAYRPLRALIESAPLSAASNPGAPLTIAHASLVPQSDVAPRSVYEPGHPHANEAGMVSYPAIDHTQEMLTATSALRAYEANLAVLQMTKALATKALEIGGR